MKSTALLLSALLLCASHGFCAETELAYLVVASGKAERFLSGGRSETVLPESNTVALGAGEKVKLHPKTTAYIITAEGSFEKKGPAEFRPETFMGTPLSPSLTKKASESGIRGSSTPEEIATKKFLFGSASPHLALLTATFNPSRSAVSGAIKVLAPLVKTCATRTAILWEAKPGVSYDIELVEAINKAGLRLTARVVADKIHNLLPFDSLDGSDKHSLKEGRAGYKLIISETGKPTTATEVDFEVVPRSGAIPPSVEIYRAHNEGRLGDALLALEAVPKDTVNKDPFLSRIAPLLLEKTK